MRRTFIALFFLLGACGPTAAPAGGSSSSATSATPAVAANVTATPTASASPSAIPPNVQQVVAASTAAMQAVSSVRYTIKADGKVLALDPVYKVRQNIKHQAPDKGSIETFEQSSYVGNTYVTNRSTMSHLIFIGLQGWSHTDLVDGNGAVLQVTPWKLSPQRTPVLFPSATFGSFDPNAVMSGSTVRDVVGPTLEGTEVQNGVRVYRVKISAMRNNGLVGGNAPGTNPKIPEIPGPSLYVACSVTIWIDSTTMLWQRMERVDRNTTDRTIFIDQFTDYFDYNATVVTAPPGF